MSKVLRCLPLAVFALVLLAAGCATTKDEPKVLNYFGSLDLGKATTDNIDRCNASAGGRYVIAFNSVGQTYEAYHELLSRPLATRQASPDLFEMDYTFTTEFADEGWLRPWPEADGNELVQKTFRGVADAVRHNGLVYGAPLTADTSMLWYRNSPGVPTPPVTWDQLIDQARTPALDGKLRLLALPGLRGKEQAELFMSLISSDLDLSAISSRLALTDRGLVDAQATIDELARAHVLHREVDRLDLRNARSAFYTGDAAFVLSPASRIDDGNSSNLADIPGAGWTRFPGVTPQTASKTLISGSSLAVSAYSRHPDLAFEAARCLAGADSQKHSAIQARKSPGLLAVYDDSEVREAMPYAATLEQALEEGRAPVKVRNYTGFVSALSNAISPLGDPMERGIGERFAEAMDEGR
jgi:multiple sugar transport system substrate-binding protein